MITEQAAAWIATAVLPAGYRRNTTSGCACQYGRCGRCTRGQHTGCLGTHQPSPHTYICDSRGMVPNGRLCAVWAVGHPCAWVCPCPDCRPAQRPRWPAVTAAGNPPAGHRGTVEALTLF